ncbi:SusC/RagA family TonB-linked outer membrane protein [Adhaeribacter rhizoryzae]|nr:SusC/RagA family TonB-linked outer membrane protein [Adhaeribacter rhizoryzae]
MKNPLPKVKFSMVAPAGQSEKSKILKCVFAFLFLLFASSAAFAQKQVSGRVTAASDNSALPGVTVVVKGTNTGTSTDPDGRYSIEIPAGQDVLTFTFVGYTAQDVAVGNRTTVNVTLREDAKALEEVVVVGYGTQRREEVTAAVANVTQEEFRQSGARNALDLVQGKVAGLVITRSSSNPNTGVAIQLRGVGSINGGNSPLVVIDGIPGGNLDLLQQDDIESISVLKDGSAAAIYGTRANGGVILVTTKKGKAGKAQFDYNTYFRKEYERDRPDFMTAEQWRARVADKIWNRPDLGASTDWYGLLLNKKNLTQNHNLALSGGGENTTYRASIFYQDLQGIARENERKQYGGRISINHTGFQDRLSAQINLATNFNNANLLGGGGWESSLQRNPTQSLYNQDGTYFFEPTTTNQVARLAQETNKRQQQTSSADAKFSLETLKNLRASVFLAVQRNNILDGAYRLLASESSLENGDAPGGGYASRSTSLSNNYTFEPTIDYNTTIAGNHSLNAVVGYSYQYFVNEGFDGNNRGFVNDIFQENNLGTGSQLRLGKSGLGSFKNDNKLIAFFGRANYSFNNKYLLSLILRREGTSRFGANNKWGNFPAVSVGWNITNEDFMDAVTFIDNLKFRAGYGVTGNQEIGNYNSLVTLGGGGSYLFPDGIYRETYGPTRNPNPDLKWEEKHEINVGLDFSLLNNRLGGSIDVFQRRIVDLLGNYQSQQPPFVLDNINANVGTLVGKGIELTLNAQAMKVQDFTWNVDLIGSTASSRLESFSNDVYKAQERTFGGIPGPGAMGDAILTREGGKIGEFVGKRFAGFDDKGNWLFYKRDGSKVPANQINRSVDPNVTDLAVIGNAVPKYFASLTNDFRYKNLGLRVFLRGRFGYDILNAQAIQYGNTVAGTNVLNSAFGKYAELAGQSLQYSDYFIEKGDHLKVDEVTLSYDFKLNTSYVRNLRVYATGANLATITGYTGTDPDYIGVTGLGPGIQGLDIYPNTRSFLIGLSVGF